jgi:dTDP-4-dehydrorhamnose reductase
VSDPGARVALVFGGQGQLGRALAETSGAGWRVAAVDLPEVDITSAPAAQLAVEAHHPALVINAAAYTAVDGAEQEPERAAVVNGVGAGHIAAAAAASGSRQIYISTDFVFDGRQGRPYAPTDPPAPLNVYGATKLDGERRVEQASGGAALIVRTAWLYGAHGSNFVLTMLRLLETRRSVQVVADQVGTPTWARSLARAIWAAAELPALRGVHHWTDAGVASWYDFAVAIREEASALHLLQRPADVLPITTLEYPTPARRPSFSVLAKEQTWAALGFRPDHWRVSLRRMLEELHGA